MLSNSVVAAMLASSYVVTLVVQLNPTLPLHPLRLVPIVTTVGLFYAVELTVIFYVVLVMRQLFAREDFSPAWVSVSVLAWLGAVAALAGAALMWANVQTFGLVLEPDTVTHVINGALTLVVAAAFFVFVGVLRAHLGQPGRVIWGLLFVAVAAGSIAAPLAVRGRGTPPLLDTRPLDVAINVDPAERQARVVLVAVDAGSLDFITSATANGRLPNFGRILDAGAVMYLATIQPTSAEAVWSAVATGKLPQKNGVRSAGSYRFPDGGDPILLLPDYCFAHLLVRFGFLIEQPHTPATLRTRTLWNILGALGIPVGVVGWPLTYPAPPVRGYLVSDLFHRAIATPDGADDTSAVYPPELQEAARRAAEADTDANPVTQASLRDQRYEAPGRTDRANDRIARELGAARPAQISIVRYQSLDPIGHYFLRYVMPSEFGDVTDEERRRFGSVLEQHYGLIDDAIGRAIRSLGPDDLLLVVSGYGMEPIGIVKRLIERVVGDPDLSGTHEAAPEGFLMAYGGPIVRGRLASRASVVDVVPTVLYFLGLPIGRDMDGYARTDLFKPAFTEERPITFIPTYDR
jgi:predicted AlkP superfamily phosphohydrolase/phosphomutase